MAQENDPLVFSDEEGADELLDSDYNYYTDEDDTENGENTTGDENEE